MQRCRAAGVSVEAELGEIGGKDGLHAPGVPTDPAAAEQLVADCGVDALAVAAGSSHATTSRTAELDLGLIAAIHERVPVPLVPLVLHGASGVPDADLVAAVRAGRTKVNIATHLNNAFATALRGCWRCSPWADLPAAPARPGQVRCGGAVTGCPAGGRCRSAGHRRPGGSDP